MTDQELMFGIRCEDTHPVYSSIMHIMRESMEDEVKAALAPNITSEAAHYNRGRAAALSDVLDYIKALREQAMVD